MLLGSNKLFLSIMLCSLNISMYVQASNLVPVERFDSVCTEMNAGLERERQQQVELARQRDELLQSKHRWG